MANRLAVIEPPNSTGAPFAKAASACCGLKVPSAQFARSRFPSKKATRSEASLSGRHLDSDTRNVMESRFGHDFSRVRIHTDAQAAASTASVGAIAYTVGRDVFFGAERYRPQTAGGRALLAHELAHVVQQRNANPAPSTLSDASPAMEAEAGLASSSFLGSAGPIAVHQTSEVALARAEEEPSLSKESTTVINIQETIDTIEGWQLGLAGYTADSNVAFQIATFFPFFFLELLRRAVQLGNLLFGVTELQSVADTLFDEAKSVGQKIKAAIWGVVIIIMDLLMVGGIAERVGVWLGSLGKVGWINAVRIAITGFLDTVFATAKEWIPLLRRIWVYAKMARRWVGRLIDKVVTSPTWQRMEETALTPVDWRSLRSLGDEFAAGVRARIEQLAPKLETEVVTQEAMDVTRSAAPVDPYWQQLQQERALEFTPDPAFESAITESSAVEGVSSQASTSPLVDLEPTLQAEVNLTKTPAKPRGFNADLSIGGQAKAGRQVKAGGMSNLVPTVRESVRRPPSRYLTDYLQRYGLTFGAEGKAAREAFNGMRPSIAEALRMRGGDIHHAIELQVLDYYPGVFTAEELNLLSNMRGIPTESLVAGGPTGKQLHNSVIRKELDQVYKTLDDVIEKGGYQPRNPDYDALVRKTLEDARRSIDLKYGEYFRWPYPSTPELVGTGVSASKGFFSSEDDE